MPTSTAQIPADLVGLKAPEVRPAASPVQSPASSNMQNRPFCAPGLGVRVMPRLCCAWVAGLAVRPGETRCSRNSRDAFRPAGSKAIRFLPGGQEVSAGG